MAVQGEYGGYQPPWAGGSGYLPGDTYPGTGAVTPGQQTPGGWNPPTLPKMGDPLATAPVAAPTVPGVPAPAAPKAPYGDYLGWNTQKLNDPTNQHSKYQFLRAMMDAGIDPSKFGEKDPSGVQSMVAALNARGINATHVAGSDDRIFWPGEGEFDAIDRTTTPGTPRFFWNQATNADGTPYQQPSAGVQAAAGMPPLNVQTGGYGAYQPPYMATDPMTGSSYGTPIPQAPTLADLMKRDTFSPFAPKGMPQ